MKGDFSRLTFEPAKQFSRVLMQQGRVQLDADWNEQASLLLYQVRALARALIGPYGGVGDAFHITPGDHGALLAIGSGLYFVDGIMISNDGSIAFVPPGDWRSTHDTTIRPVPADYLIYLGVAERHITFVNDDDIREKALGQGVDTASRTKVAAVVSAVRVDGLNTKTGAERNKAVADALNGLHPAARPGMRASVESQAKPHDICNVPPFAQFRGSGNQLYRVEIHNPSTKGAGATFKWSRENGSVVFPVTGAVQGTKVRIARYDRDRFSLERGDWVEFEDDDLLATGSFFELSRVESVDSDSITVDKVPVSADFGAHPEKHPILRRWDHAPLPGGATYYHRGTIAIQDEKRSYPLEAGLQVGFQAKGAEYVRGDYWVIPARTLNGGIDWPGANYLPARRAEAGLAPLASMTIKADGTLDGAPKDLRSVINVGVVSPP